MGITMNQDKIKALANELAKDLYTPEDLSAFSAHLTKITVESALNAEMEAHLDYAAHEARGRNGGNSRALRSDINSAETPSHYQQERSPELNPASLTITRAHHHSSMMRTFIF